MAKYKQDGKWARFRPEKTKTGLDGANARAEEYIPASDCKRKLMKMAVA